MFVCLEIFLKSCWFDFALSWRSGSVYSCHGGQVSALLFLEGSLWCSWMLCCHLWNPRVISPQALGRTPASPRGSTAGFFLFVLFYFSPFFLGGRREVSVRYMTLLGFWVQLFKCSTVEHVWLCVWGLTGQCCSFVVSDSVCYLFSVSVVYSACTFHLKLS